LDWLEYKPYSKIGSVLTTNGGQEPAFVEILWQFGLSTLGTHEARDLVAIDEKRFAT
jgi:hypothetical protein